MKGNAQKITIKVEYTNYMSLGSGYLTILHRGHEWMKWFCAGLYYMTLAGLSQEAWTMPGNVANAYKWALKNPSIVKLIS